jgi:hypothetical protein
MIIFIAESIDSPAFLLMASAMVLTVQMLQRDRKIQRRFQKNNFVYIAFCI